MRVVRPAAQILAWVWVALVVVLLAGLVVVTVTGGRLDIVTTASMSPAIPKGSLAATRDVDARSVAVGDVITYRNRNEVLVMHRVIEIVGPGDGVLYRTQGDLNPSADPQLVGIDEIEGRVRWSLSGFGTVARALRPPWGLLWLIALPAGVLWLARKPRPAEDPGDPGATDDLTEADGPAELASERALADVTADCP